MNSMRIETTLQNDGELYISNLPYHKGDQLEVIFIFHEKSDEEKRKIAKKEFLELARNSKFRSLGPYPTRDELHERH
jgi:hypothetical protein